MSSREIKNLEDEGRKHSIDYDNLEVEDKLSFQGIVNSDIPVYEKEGLLMRLSFRAEGLI